MNEFFQMLKKDHKEVKGILEKLTATTENESSKREDLFQKLREELVPHMKAEESAFYPPLVKKEAAREDAMEGIEEHHASELILKELETMPKADDQWGAKMGVFKELVEHHIEEEEENLFSSAEKVLDQDEFNEIKEQFEEDKQNIRKTFK